MQTTHGVSASLDTPDPKADALDTPPGSPAHESVLRLLHPLQQQQRWRDDASAEARLFAQQRGLGEQWNLGGWLLAQPMARYPDKIALQQDGQTLSYAGLAQRMGWAARHLLEAGVQSGTRVAVVAHDSLAQVSALLAVMHVGAIAVLVNPLLADPDIDAALVQAEAAHVLTDHASRARFGHAVWQGPVTDLDALGVESADPSIPGAASTHPLDAAFAVFTSGSSGRAKLIEHRHQDVLVATDRYASQLLDLRASDVLFSASRTSFAFGLQNLLIGLCKGARVVLGPAKISAAAIADIIAHARPTVMFAVPTLYQRLLDDPQLVEQVRDHGLRMCVAAGERLPGAVARRWHALTGVRVLDSLGSTEAFSTYLSNVADVDVPGATGKLVPGFDALLRHADGRPCRNGERGTLWLRGPSLSIDLHDPVSVQRMERGWYCTHDVFWRDGDGYFHFCGRSDEMFKVAGQWVSPLDLEEVLLGHPQVREVAVTACGSDEDTLRTQAWVVSDTPSEALADELRELCKRELDARRYPHHVEFVAELPRTGTGKLLRSPLRQRAAAQSSFPLTTA